MILKRVAVHSHVTLVPYFTVVRALMRINTWNGAAVDERQR